MPLYEYQCGSCGRFEVIRKFSDKALKKCPTCGRKVEKLASAPAFHLKGTGWYVTDYAKKSNGGDKGEKKDSDGKTESSTKADAKDAKSGDAKTSTDSTTSSGTDKASSASKTTGAKKSPASGSSPT